MKLKRFLSSVLALVLIVSLPVSALAADWYLEDGDITVSADSSGQTVSQGDTSVADDAPVIRQRDSSAATDSTITISTSDDATANVTIEDVNISSSGDSIDVGSSSANITLNGDNKLSSESGSGMHVSDGDVTITGSGSLKAESKGDNNNNAAIGSHENEDMSGDITIGGDAQVTAESGRNGAGIGSGDDGEMTGDITIGGSAKVSAKSGNDGAGIGSGDDGEMTGSITVSGSSQVTAISGNDGAGIGGSETVPTAPGTYPVTCVVRLDDETIEFQIGTFVVPEPKSPAEAVQSAPLYRVTDKDGVDIAYKAEKNDGVLTITADEDHAVLTGTLAGIEQLKAQGVEKIVFVTNGASSAFSLNDLLEKGEIGETYKLTHDGKTVTFTLGEKMTDISLAYR